VTAITPPRRKSVERGVLTRRRLNRILIWILVAVSLVWIFLPLAMAVLWSLVDPSAPWSYPDLFPRELSFARWRNLWANTSLPEAIANSYKLAPLVGLAAITLAAPTAYAFGRLEFRGKSVAQVMSLLPIVLPGFAVAIFFSSVLLKVGIFNRYLSIMLGHIVLFMPYAIRILTVSFAQIPQDLIDAARMFPGFASAFIIIFILSIEEFALAFILGSPDFTTIPTILFSFLGFNFVRANAAVVSLVLVIPNVAILLFLERLLQSVGLNAGTKG